MSDYRERVADDERDVPLDDDAELETPPATLDPDERIEEIRLDHDALEEREAAIEAGQIDPG